MASADRWERMLRSLDDVSRRRLLMALLEDTPRDGSVIVPEEVHVDERELSDLQIDYVHTHLPKLEQFGYITWNRATHEVTTGPEFDEIHPLLELLHEHRDELPDGWL